MADSDDTDTDSWVIPSSCDARMAVALHERLRGDVATASAARPIRVDLTPGAPTAFALQLAAATAASLRQQAAFAGYGAAAAPLFDPDLSQKEPT